MKIGMALHPDRGIDAVFAEARAADQQGFDSIWLSDHLANPFGPDRPDAPMDSFTLMTGIGAVTRRAQLGWAMLNVSFRHPAVLAKTLATLDHITKGRVIATLGSGWFKKEYEAYGVPLVDDHDERVAFGREVARFVKEAWTHPAPEKVNYKSKWFEVRDLAFNPAPYRKPHPPIWLGGESDATIAAVKEMADGWVLLGGTTPEKLRAVLAQPDWPKRNVTLVRGARIHVGETKDAAVAEARGVMERGGRFLPPTLEDFLAREIVGTPAECLRRIAELKDSGVSYLRFDPMDAAHQERVARLILPALASGRA